MTAFFKALVRALDFKHANNMNKSDYSNWDPEDLAAFKQVLGENVSLAVERHLAEAFLSGMRRGLSWSRKQMETQWDVTVKAKEST